MKVKETPIAVRPSRLPGLCALHDLHNPFLRHCPRDRNEIGIGLAEGFASASSVITNTSRLTDSGSKLVTVAGDATVLAYEKGAELQATRWSADKSLIGLSVAGACNVIAPFAPRRSVCIERSSAARPL